MASCLVSHHHYPLCSSAIFRLLSRESYSSCCTVSAGCPPVCNRLSSRRWLNCSSNSKCRLDNFNFKSRCSVANNDVQFDHVVPEEVQDDTSTMTSGCLFPVHLKSGITEAESLTLLTEDPYIDTLLSTLPILTAEDQKALAATPAHPEGLRALYASCLAGNLVEQLWNFACPAALAMLHPCLQPVAVMSFFIKLSFISGGPLIGKFMDSFPRVPAYNCLIIVQVAAQLLSVAMIIHAYSISPGFESSLLLQPWFAVLVFAVAVERLCGLALAVAMDRDWVVLLAGTNRPIALAQANAILNRIALLCEIAGSTLFGILLSKYDPVTCLKIAAGLMLCSVPVEVILTWLTNKLSAGVLARAKPLHADSGTCKANAECIGRMGLAVIKHGWVEYLHQPVLPASLANVLLYFNVVLAPGSLLTAFLTHRGLNPSVIGGFTGLCAFMGVAATFMSANLVKRLGILKAGALGLTFQASLLTLAVAVYYGGSFKQRASLLFFLILIVLSRIGHMSYDIVGAQILQTGIPSSKANLIGTTEASVASLAELVMLGVAIVANDVSNFGFLAIMSLLSVVGAAWMFWQWLLNPTEEQRNLFSFDPQF